MSSDVAYISCGDTNSELYQVNFAENNIKLRLNNSVSTGQLELVNSEVHVLDSGTYKVSWFINTNQGQQNFSSYLSRYVYATLSWVTLGYGQSSTVVAKTGHQRSRTSLWERSY